MNELDATEIYNFTESWVFVQRNATNVLNETWYKNISFSFNGSTASQPSSAFRLGPIDVRLWYPYGFETIIYGYILFPYGICFLIASALMTATLIANRLLSPTNIVLIAISLLDTATILFPASLWLYFYGILDYKHYLPFNWCRVYHDVAEVLPSVFHGTSITLTFMLAVQKFIIVVYPFKAKRWCTPKRTMLGISLITVLVFTFGLTGLFEFSYYPIPVPSKEDFNSTMLGCVVGEAYWYHSYGFFNYFGIKYFIRATIFVVPATLGTLIFGLLLLWKFHVVKKRRGKMSGSEHAQKTVDPEGRMTAAALWMILAFLVVELPSAFVIIVDSIHWKFGVELIPNKTLTTMSIISNCVICLTLPSNFVIYVCFCRSFRKAFLNTLMVCRRHRKDVARVSVQAMHTRF